MRGGLLLSRFPLRLQKEIPNHNYRDNGGSPFRNMHYLKAINEHDCAKYEKGVHRPILEVAVFLDCFDVFYCEVAHHKRAKAVSWDDGTEG